MKNQLVDSPHEHGYTVRLAEDAAFLDMLGIRMTMSVDYIYEWHFAPYYQSHTIVGKLTTEGKVNADTAARWSFRMWGDDGKSHNLSWQFRDLKTGLQGSRDSDGRRVSQFSKILLAHHFRTKLIVDSQDLPFASRFPSGTPKAQTPWKGV